MSSPHVHAMNEAFGRGDTFLDYPPLLVNLEPTNLCNLRCPFCPVSQMDDNRDVARGMMDLGLFRAVVKELTTFRPEVALNLGGESLLHPGFVDMVHELKDAGLFVFVDSNAMRLTAEQVDGMVRAGLDRIVVCLDGDDAASYEQLRVRGKFEVVVKNIRMLLERRNASGARRPEIVIKNIRDYRPDEEPSFPAAFAELFRDTPPDEYSATWADYWPGTHREKLKRDYQVQPHAEEYSPCINLWKKMAISWDGDVYVCCLDLNRTTLIGNVLDGGLLGLWNSEAMQHQRRLHAASRQAELALCKNCNQIRRTPARAEAGLEGARDDRYTPWVRTAPIVQLRRKELVVHALEPAE